MNNLTMDTIFTMGDASEDNVRLNLDDLYERKKQHDLNTLAVYNRVLARLHTRIKTVSRQQAVEQFCWYVIPEMIIGVPKYDHTACTAYIIDKLKENGFQLRYTHPNLLFVSWKHWIPSYVRSEIKKKTGVIVDGYGNKVEKTEGKTAPSINPDTLIFHKNDNNVPIGASKPQEFKPIDTYRPSGNLIYNQDLLKRIEDKSKT
jgi:hypothetical protein